MPDDFHYIGIINALLHADGGKIFRELFHLEQIALATKVKLKMNNFILILKNLFAGTRRQRICSGMETKIGGKYVPNIWW